MFSVPSPRVWPRAVDLSSLPPGCQKAGRFGLSVLRLVWKDFHQLAWQVKLSESPIKSSRRGPDPTAQTLHPGSEAGTSRQRGHPAGCRTPSDQAPTTAAPAPLSGEGLAFRCIHPERAELPRQAAVAMLPCGTPRPYFCLCVVETALGSNAHATTWEDLMDTGQPFQLSAQKQVALDLGQTAFPSIPRSAGKL